MSVETAVVPMLPLMTVRFPELVIPAVPPKSPNSAADPSATGCRLDVAPVVKLHGSGTAPGPIGLPARSAVPLVTLAVYTVLAVRLADGVNVAIKLIASYAIVP